MKAKVITIEYADRLSDPLVLSKVEKEVFPLTGETLTQFRKRMADLVRIEGNVITQVEIDHEE